MILITLLLITKVFSIQIQLYYEYLDSKTLDFQSKLKDIQSIFKFTGIQYNEKQIILGEQILKDLTIENLPTLLLQHQNSTYFFKGVRTKQTILEWIRNIISSPPIQINCLTDFYSFIQSHNKSFIYFGSEIEPELEEYKKTSRFFTYNNFAFTTNKTLIEMNNNGLVGFKQIQFKTMNENWTLEFGTNFIQNFMDGRPGTLKYGYEKMKLFNQRIIVMISDSLSEYAIHQFKSASYNFPMEKQLLFVYGSQNDEYFVKFKKMLKAKMSEIQIFYIRNQTHIYHFQNTLNASNIIDFILDCKQNQVKIYRKSQIIPSYVDQRLKPLKALNADLFNEMISNRKKQYLIYFFKSDEDLPRELELLLSLAVTLENSNIDTCFLNMNLNYIEMKSADGLYFFSHKQREKPVKFKQQLQIEDIVKWVLDLQNQDL